MDNLILGIETEFYFLTGVYIEGISGLFFGLLLFISVLLLIRYEKNQDPVLTDIDITNEIGNEKEAKINLSRSLIEMNQVDEPRRLLDEVLNDQPTEEEKTKVHLLLSRINS
tara:strand:- start:2960 stop:3295 length:336 start_codon:yes stop_codon:yes gene_type:complete